MFQICCNKKYIKKIQEKKRKYLLSLDHIFSDTKIIESDEHTIEDNTTENSIEIEIENKNNCCCFSMYKLYIWKVEKNQNK